MIVIMEGDNLIDEHKDIIEELSNEEEDEQEMQINSNGSVLMPSDAPYDKFERIKEANLELFSTDLTKPRSTCKVQFSQIVDTHTVDYFDVVEDTVVTEKDEDFTPVDEEEQCKSSEADSEEVSKPPKLLLVTVPTAFTEQLEDEAGEDVEEENAINVTDEELLHEETVDQPQSFCEDEEESGEDEEETVIEDLTEECSSVRLVSTFPCSKPVLIKDARVEEEDSDGDDQEHLSNQYVFHNDTIEDLTEDFDVFTIANQNEEDSKKAVQLELGCKTIPKINNESKKKFQNFNKIAKKVEKDERTIKFRKYTCNNDKLFSQTLGAAKLREQCPIYKRNYSSQCGKKKKELGKSLENRPSTAPNTRHCCNYWDQRKLPDYNGLRSEYGLTKEQIEQKRREKLELAKTIRTEKEQKYFEELRRQKENDIMFNSWLVRKKKEAAKKFCYKKLQNTFQFKTVAAPTTQHLNKISALRKKLLKREHNSYSLEEFFKSADPHEEKTYRIYLGLCME